ncbi:hypothetical protein [Segetibacter sp.]|jgi:hypothetical protein|uniref:hypothetical protein n=1 Tax=Segetibacter sp. TaxID=2231182 RepID=UPI0026244294|nr:hypothetical protein [Segetibacter sp.]MCW3081325.1 hypothetical protein [Segetibacter sp.]
MKKEKLQQLAHLIAGIITLAYGFDAFELGDFASATYFLALAIVFLIVAGAHKWIAEKFIRGDVAINLLESVTIIYAAASFRDKAHPFLYYTVTAIGISYFILAIANLFALVEPVRKSYKGKKRRKASSHLFKEQKLVQSDN